MNIRKKYFLTVVVCLIFLAITIFIATKLKNIDYAPQNRQLQNSSNQCSEMRAVWVPFMDLDMKGTDYSEKAFKEKFDNIIADTKKLHMNTLIVHTRPFGDALYPSKIFPWSHIISGTQGNNPGFDPLDYMVKASHQSGLKIHAWINPLRIQKANQPSIISNDNPFTKWKNSTNVNEQNFVVDYGTEKYYDPSYVEVQTLIIDGIKEIVENYDIDGIHFDDYFYPNGAENFDTASYNEYCAKSGTNNNLPLLEWRSANINSLIFSIYSTIKSLKPNVEFGISPQCNMSNDINMGADIFSWCKTPGYIDYICPQTYVNFENPILPFAKAVDEWKKIIHCSNIKLYYGLGVYKAGSDVDNGTWKKSDSILQQQIEYARKSGCDGFMLFSYGDLKKPQTENEVANAIKLFN